MKPADIHRRLAALEDRARVIEDPRLAMTKEERDAAVRAVLDDPDRVREIMVDLVGEENAGNRTDAFMRRQAVTAAALRADT